MRKTLLIATALMGIILMATTVGAITTVPSDTPVSWDAPTEDVNGEPLDIENIKYRIYLKEKIGNAEALVLGETKDLSWVVILPAQGIFYNVGVSAFGLKDNEEIPNTESLITWSDSTDTEYVPEPFEFLEEETPPAQYKPPTNLHVGADPAPELISLQSGGGNVWDDSFSPTWVSNPVPSGNFDFYAEIITDEINESYRQAGIAYRDASGDSVLILSRYDNTVRRSFQRRDTVSERSSLNNTAQDTGTNPSWVRMERVDGVINTYYATTEPKQTSDWTILEPGGVRACGNGPGELGVMAIHPSSSTFLAQFDFKPWGN